MTEAGASQVSVTSEKKGSSFASDVLKLVGGSFSAQLVGVLIVPVLSRLYSPDDFGTASVFASIVGIISAVSSLRYERAILLPSKDEDAFHVFVGSLLFVGLFVCASVIVVVFASETIASWLRAPNLADYLYLAPIAIMISGAFLPLRYWSSRNRRFGLLSVARLSTSLLTNTSQLLIGLIGWATAGALISTRVVGQAAGALVLGIGDRQGEDQTPLPRVKVNQLVSILKRYKKFPLVDTWGTLINNASGHLPSLLLSAFFSQTVVGYYDLTVRIIAIPISLLGGAIAEVFFQRASELQSSAEDLQAFAERTFRRLVVLGLLPALVLSILAPELVATVFGPDWIEAGRYVQIFSLLLIFRLVSSPLSTLFIVLERQELLLGANLAILAVRTTALVVGGLISNVYLAMLLLVGTSAVVYGGLAAWTLSLVGVELRSAGDIFARWAAIAVISVMPVFLARNWLRLPLGWLLLISVFMCSVYYLGYLRKRDLSLYQDLIEFRLRDRS
jgi:O-antigen/teichoic acid export membrane protein